MIDGEWIWSQPVLSWQLFIVDRFTQGWCLAQSHTKIAEQHLPYLFLH
jgi:hypothetical protein